MRAKSSRVPFFRTTVDCCGRSILIGISSFKVRLRNGPGAKYPNNQLSERLLPVKNEAEKKKASRRILTLQSKSLVEACDCVR